LAIMADAGFPPAMLEMGEVEAMARTLGIEVITLEIRRAEDIAPAFEALNSKADALYVVINELLNASRVRITNLAEAARLPSVYGTVDWVQSGGAHILRTKLSNPVRACGRFYRQDFAWNSAGRYSSRAANQV
jgi:putative ABC transport system substrate-binding protein